MGFTVLGILIFLLFCIQNEAKNTAQEIYSHGGAAVAYRCDVSNYHEVQKTAKKIRLEVGHPDIVVSEFSLIAMKWSCRLVTAY